MGDADGHQGGGESKGQAHSGSERHGKSKARTFPAKLVQRKPFSVR
jgi:hypothetical protein